METISEARTIDAAKALIRKHCPIDWPDGRRCLNCHEFFPCRAFTWGFDELAAAGYTERQIAALDVRTGPWS